MAFSDKTEVYYYIPGPTIRNYIEKAYYYNNTATFFFWIY